MKKIDLDLLTAKMLLCYLKYHNYEENITDIPAWSEDIYYWLKEVKDG